jgi:hypothetical protein
MPHHLRQHVHHNINQNTTTDNIKRPHESVADPEIQAALDVAGDNRADHKGGKEGKKPPRGLPDEYAKAG